MISGYDNILQLKDRFDVFLFDAYGVFWDGSKFFDGAKEAMAQLVKDGKTVYILSNTTQVVSDAEKSYDKKGLAKGTHYHEIITSGEAAMEAIAAGNVHFKQNPKARKVYQFGTPNKKIFADTDYVNVDNLADAELIYISIPQFTEEEYNALKDKYGKSLFESKLPKEGEPRKWDSKIGEPFYGKIKELLKSKLPVLNANPDYTASEGVKDSDKKNFVVRQGYITDILRKNGAEVIEFGKPHKEIYDFTFNLLEKNGIKADKSRICMIGDTLRTDIKGANNAGIKGVLCTETGVTANQLSYGKKLEDIEKFEDAVVDYTIKGVAVNADLTNGSSVSTDNNKSADKFELVPGLAKKPHIMDLKLCTVLFENNKFYPWVFLVPMRNGVKNMTFLSMDDRLQLMKEMAIVEKVMWTLFPCDQTNVAMIGNKTPQLHVHILCRKDGDPDWPTTVWNNHKEPYTEEEMSAAIAKIKVGIEAEMKKPEYKY